MGCFVFVGKLKNFLNIEQKAVTDSDSWRGELITSASPVIVLIK